MAADKKEYPAGDLARLAEARGVELRPTELAAGDLDLAGWRELIGPLARVARGSQWWFGDAVVHAQEKFRMPLYEIADEAGVALQTLKNVATVSRWVAPDVRIAELSWSMHRPVARVRDKGEQRHWLAQALDNGWDEDFLRQAMAGSREPREHDVDTETPAYRCPNCNHEWSGNPRPARGRRIAAIAS